MGELVLYNIPPSLCSQKVRLALVEKGVPFRNRWVNIGPLDGEIIGGFSDSYVHLGVIGVEGSTAIFDGVTVRQFQ